MTSSGKDVTRRALIDLGVKPLITYTTREPRDYEVDGEAYHFISEEEFLKKKEEGFFAETTSYETVNGLKYYGSALKDYMKDTDNKVIILNPSGLHQIKKNKSITNPTVFFLIADEEILWNRLRQRGDESEEARRRLNTDDEDFKNINKYIDFSIRNDGSKTPKEIAEIILYLYQKPISNEKKGLKLFIDLDEVTFNTTKCIVKLYNEDFCYYSDYTPIRWTDVNTWNFTELKAATSEQINTYFNQPRFFANVEYMDNAYEVINELSNEYEITFVSHGYSPNLRIKEEFIKDVFPFAKFIGVNLKEHKDKSCVDMSGGIFIDDGGNNLLTSNAKYKICFGDVRPWNEEYKGERCNNWYDVKRKISEIEIEIYQRSNYGEEIVYKRKRVY